MWAKTCSDVITSNFQIRPTYYEYAAERLMDIGAYGHFWNLATKFDRQFDVPYDDFDYRQLPQYTDFIR